MVLIIISAMAAFVLLFGFFCAIITAGREDDRMNK